VCFKIVPKLALTHDYRVTNFLYLGIESLGPREDLQNEKHWNCCFAVLSFCVISFSITRAPSAAECMAETYRMRGYPCSRLDSVRKCSR
jgi:hypothetical protein